MIDYKDLDVPQRDAMKAELKAAFGRLLRRWEERVPMTEDEWDIPEDDKKRLIFERLAAGQGDSSLVYWGDFISQWRAIRDDIQHKHLEAASKKQEMDMELHDAFVKLLWTWNGAIPLKDHEWGLDRDVMNVILTSRLPVGIGYLDDRDSFLAQWRDISDGIRAKYKEDAA